MVKRKVKLVNISDVERFNAICSKFDCDMDRSVFLEERRVRSSFSFTKRGKKTPTSMFYSGKRGKTNREPLQSAEILVKKGKTEKKHLTNHGSAVILLEYAV